MKHVLIIDDDPDEYDIFLTALKEANAECTCIWAESDKQGLEILKSEKPDIVFVDQNMPGMPGLECIKAIRRLPLHYSTCVVLYSTHVDEEIRAAARQAGATFSYQKPQKISAVSTLIQIISDDCLLNELQVGFSR